MSEDEWDKPTPTEKQSSGSWQGLKNIALELRARLDNAAVAKMSSNLILRDPEGAELCSIWAERLSELASDLERWPLYPELASEQRLGHTKELFDLVRKGGDLLSKMPGGPW